MHTIIKTFSVVILFVAFLYISNLSVANNPADSKSYNYSSIAPIQNIFMQGNNINTVFRTDGIMNYDWFTFVNKDAGMIWPVNSPFRVTINYTSGIWIGAKVIFSGNIKELRLGAAFYSSHFTPGNIPVVGGIPPPSVCADPIWKGYYVQLTDQSLINGGTRTKVAGGRTYTFNYDAWSSWPVSLGAPYVEINSVPGYQPGWNSDRPGIGNSSARPEEILFMVYMDYTNCTDSIHLAEISLPGGTRPIGMELHQLSFMFNCPTLQNMYFVKSNIINKSGRTWDSTYISYVDDIDIGNGTTSSRDDAVGCDTSRQLGFIYNAYNIDSNYGSSPPALGYRLLQSPLKYTGNPFDTAKLPYDTLIGYKLIGMTGFNHFINSSPDPCLNDPDNAEAGYNFMRGMDGCGRVKINPITHLPTLFNYTGDACNRTGWVDNASHDVRFMMNCGPITMNSLDTQTIVLAAVIGRGTNNFQSVCQVQSLSDSALKYYYNNFANCITIGIKNLSNEIPGEYRLYQNYPNPFNPATRIQFAVPLNKGGERGLFTKLIIYDLLGRETAVLVNDKLQPGAYEVEWDATVYPSGVYFYILTAGDYSETKKMVLIK